MPETRLTRHARRGPRTGAAGIVALALIVAGCGGASAAPAVTPGTTPSPAAAVLMTPDEQAFIPVDESWEILSAFDAVWVSGNIGTMDDGTLTRIDPKTNTVTAQLKVSSATDGIAATETAIWIVDGDSRSVREVDPATDKLTGRSASINDDGGDLAYANGSLWHFGWDVVERIDPEAGTSSAVPLLGGTGGSAAFAVTGDAIYKLKDGTLFRFDAAGTKLEATNKTDVAGGALAVGPAGVYAPSSTASVAILDPVTLKLVQAIGSAPAAAADGGTWSLGNAPASGGAIVADAAGAWVRFSPSVIGRVDPAAGTISLLGPFPSEASGPSPIAVADGSLWITNEGAGSGGADGGKPGVHRVAVPTP